MSFRPEHEIHRRRFGRNVGLGVVLALFVVLIFGLTVVKIREGSEMQGYDHVVQPENVPQGDSQ